MKPRSGRTRGSPSSSGRPWPGSWHGSGLAAAPSPQGHRTSGGLCSASRHTRLEPVSHAGPGGEGLWLRLVPSASASRGRSGLGGACAPRVGTDRAWHLRPVPSSTGRAPRPGPALPPALTAVLYRGALGEGLGGWRVKEPESLSLQVNEGDACLPVLHPISQPPPACTGAACPWGSCRGATSGEMVSRFIGDRSGRPRRAPAGCSPAAPPVLRLRLTAGLGLRFWPSPWWPGRAPRGRKAGREAGGGVGPPGF